MCLIEKDHGPKYLAKGVGKGIIGLFTKPIGSIFDGMSVSLDSIRRFAQSGRSTEYSTRLPRHLLTEVAILPFSNYQAEGFEIMRDLQNDNIALNESYWAHIYSKYQGFLLVITDK